MSDELGKQSNHNYLIRNVTRFIVYGAFLTLTVLVLQNPAKYRYAAQDWWRLRNYQPSVEIAQIADRLDFTDIAQNTFFATDPKLLDKVAFSDKCPEREQSNVLGCYVTTSNTYLLDVDEPDIEQIEDVTAAHELLHAVWDRLDITYKAELRLELERVFNEVKDERLINLMKSYENTNTFNDPDLISNELHSILGTEVENVGPGLETHYSRYFHNRGQVVKMYKSYEAEFEKRQDRIEAIQAKLDKITVQINAKDAEVNSLSAQNDRVVAQINQLRSQNRVEESNKLVPKQNRLAAEINTCIKEINSLIRTFNSLVKENNELALELNQLTDSLDSRSNP
jgi:hypothetical protein